MGYNALHTRIQAHENTPARLFWEQYFSLLEDNDRPLMSMPLQGGPTFFTYTFPLATSAGIWAFVRNSDKRLFFFLSAMLATVIRKSNIHPVIFSASPNYDIDSKDLNKDIFLIQKVNNDDAFRQLLLSITNNYKTVMDNIQYPVAEMLQEQITDTHKRITDYYFSLENLRNRDAAVSTEHATEFYFSREEANNLISVKIKCNLHKAGAAYADSLYNAMIRVTESVLTNIDTRIGEISLISFEEQGRMINRFPVQVNYPQKTIQQIFEEVAARFPDFYALKFGDIKITYEELNRRANRLASWLRKKGVGRNIVIGLLLEPGPDTIVAILAILKAGGAYLPIDNGNPGSRISEIILDSGVKILITNEVSFANSQLAPDKHEIGNAELVLLDNIINQLAGEPAGNLTYINAIHDLAYVIYTSGSTGKPKGAMIEHRNVVRLLFNEHFQFSFSEMDVWTLFHRYSFDFSVWEMFGALLYGGKLVIIPMDLTRDPDTVIDIVRKNKVTVFNQTPTAFYNFINHALLNKELSFSLRYIIFGGEALKPAMLKDWHNRYPGIRLINMYGITETTVHVTYKEIGSKEINDDIGNIGCSLPTLYSIVTDDAGNAVPPGFPGELWVGGEGVCRGYINNESLTKERFIHNDQIVKGTIYKSGDLVKIIENGELEYIGRMDNQIKIRGHRIEINEIEKCIAAVDGIRSNIVVYHSMDADNTYLCCYYISDLEYRTDEFRNLLKARLPEYMIPHFFAKLDKFPLTRNGKINIQALPEPKSNFRNIVLPRNHTEETLFNLWRSALALENFGITHTFFELGGDSIKVLKLLYRINEVFKTDIDLQTFYANPTIEGLAVLFDKTPQTSGIEEAIVAETSQYLEKLKTDLLATIGSFRKDIEDIYPMTDVQLGMVYNNLRSEETKTIYSDQKLHALLIEHFDEDVFRNALLKVVQGNEILRTAFTLNDFEIPLQIVYRQIALDYSHFSLLQKTEAERAEIIGNEIDKNREQNFDFSKPGLFRVKTFICEDHKVVVLLHFHHSIIDGWSYAIFLKELKQAYHTLYSNRVYDVKQIRYHQRNHVIAEMVRKKQDGILNFWKKELEDLEEIVSFPKRINSLKFVSRKYETFKEISDYNRVKALSDRLNISVKSIYFAAYLYFIYRLSGEPGLIVGLTTTTRPLGEDSDKLIGCFLNVIPVKYIIDTKDNVSHFLKQVHQKLVEVAGYDKLSLFEIEKRLTVRKKGEVLVGNFFTYNDFGILDEERHEHAGLPDVPFYDYIRKLGTEHSDMPFQFTVNKGNNNLRYILQASGNFVEESLAQNAGSLYDEIINHFLSQPELPLSEIEIVGHEGKKQVLHDFNNTDYNYNSTQTVLDFFEDRVKRFPHDVAVAEDEMVITYRELNEKANSLALHLLKNGCQQNDVAAVLLDRSINLIISIVGVLKAGLVYMPVVPGLPPDRILYMLNDSGCSVMITSKVIEHTIPFKCIYLEDAFTETVNNPGISLSAMNPAYIIYTSGTTGKPKGVEIEHGALMNRLLWMIKHFGITTHDNILNKTPVSFDVSIWELFMWMITGSRLCILTPGKEGDPAEIVKAIRHYDISVLHFVPSMLKPFLEHIEDNSLSTEMNFLRVVVSSGEALGTDIADHFYRVIHRALLSNLYGPTEATIDVSYFNCPPEQAGAKIPIGKPIDNIKLLILNKDLRLQPVGAPGELFILGAGLARGYVNNPTFTNEKFIPCPYFEGQLMYKTGDLCRWLPDGNIEYFGRNDSQFKIRGFRIESDEIVFHIKKYPSIIDAVVNVIESRESGDKMICLYYISKDELDVFRIKQFLKDHIMEYMIPAFFIRVEKFPVTANGKLDRKRLPLPDMELPDDCLQLPVSDLEKNIATIWSEVLQINTDKIHVHQNYFDSGGHSLNALKVQSKMLKTFNVKITLQEIFNNPTIKDLSLLIQKKSPIARPIHVIPVAPQKQYYKTSYQQRSLFFIQQLNPESTAYNMPFLIHVTDNSINWLMITAAINSLVKRHAIFRTTYSVINGQLVQIVNAYTENVPPVITLPGSLKIEDELSRFIQPFNLLEEPSYRISFFECNNNRYILFDIHHIAGDGMALKIVFSDFYALLDGVALPRVPIAYKDYAEWIHAEDGLKMMEVQGAYWLNEFADYTVTPPLPFEYKQSRTTDFFGKRISYQLGKEQLNGVYHLLQKNNCTLFMFLCLVYNILLYKLSGVRRNIIGSPVSARSNEQLQSVVGMFANTLAIQIEIQEQLTFTQMLLKVREKLLMNYENQDFPFELLVDRLGIKREIGRNPLFDSMLVLQNYKEPHTVNNGKMKIINNVGNTSKFDLSIIGNEVSEELNLTFEYNNMLFDAPEIESFVNKFDIVIGQVVMNPSINIADIRLLSGADESKMATLLNRGFQKSEYNF